MSSITLGFVFIPLKSFFNRFEILLSFSISFFSDCKSRYIFLYDVNKSKSLIALFFL